MMKADFYSIPQISHTLFGNTHELLPSVTELFELEMANLEYQVLTERELLQRSAFFKAINGRQTHHYLLYAHPSGSVTGRSVKTKSYFENRPFSTGYATHSLFPYRGKFHPQLIKGLLNIIGIKKGETLLDPMCGSGTANIEAALLGIHSYAVDVSPFCQFMTRTKYEALTLDKTFLEDLSGKTSRLFDFFNTGKVSDQLSKIKNPEKSNVYDLALLAFLDAMGYAKRVVKSTHRELFEKVLNRYVSTVLDFLNNRHFDRKNLGCVEVLTNSDALNLGIEDHSIDAVITSPPYSFAIDYAENDEPQLEYLGYSVASLKSRMIGLKGKTKTERLQQYFRDMAGVCSEVKRVLKTGKYFVMIIGSNTNQTGGIRLENTMIAHCEKMGFSLVKSILKPIKGMRNTMKEEYILFFRNVMG